MPNAVRFLAGEEAAFPGTQPDEAKKFREALRAEPSLLIIFGSEFRGRDIEALVNFGMGLPHARFACLGDYVNSRGAADMGLLPGLLPGYVPVTSTRRLCRGIRFPAHGSGHGSGGNVRCRRSAVSWRRSTWWVRTRFPATGSIPRRSRRHFIVVQDMFLTETALLADVVLPTSNLYEKAGTVTNTYGDQQLVKKAGDRAGRSQ